MLFRLALVTLLGMVALALPTSAAAAKKVVVADCGVGGCRCMLSTLGVDEVELLTGEPAPAGAEGMTLVAAFDQMVWSPKSPKEIDGYFGGSGNCPIELFPGTGANKGPRDGVWEFHNSEIDTSGCPLAALAGRKPATVARKRIVWGGRFDPKKYYEPHVVNLMRWTRLNDANWRGVVNLPMGPVGGAVRVQLVNPTTFRGWNETTLSGEEAEESRCFTLQSDFTARWVSE